LKSYLGQLYTLSINYLLHARIKRYTSKCKYNYHRKLRDILYITTKHSNYDMSYTLQETQYYDMSYTLQYFSPAYLHYVKWQLNMMYVFT